MEDKANNTGEKFFFDITNIVEHEDGSATMFFDMSEKAKEHLLRYAVLDILTKAAHKVLEEQGELLEEPVDDEESVDEDQTEGV